MGRAILDIKCRPARLEDASGIRALVRSAYKPYLNRMDREPAPILADYPALILKQVVTVAEADGKIAGMLVCYPSDDALHIENVAVDPSFQGHGIGSLLMDHAEGKARSENLVRVDLYTNEVMTENISFNEARGYSVRERAIQDGYARVFFELKLNSDASG